MKEICVAKTSKLSIKDVAKHASGFVEEYKSSVGDLAQRQIIPFAQSRNETFKKVAKIAQKKQGLTYQQLYGKAEDMSSYRNLDSATKTKMNDTLVNGDLDGKIYSTEELRAMGYTDEQAGVYLRVRNALQNSFFDVLDSYEKVGLIKPEIVAEFKQKIPLIKEQSQLNNALSKEAQNVLENHISYKVGYIPRRRFGEYRVQGVDANGNISHLEGVDAKLWQSESALANDKMLALKQARPDLEWSVVKEEIPTEYPETKAIYEVFKKQIDAMAKEQVKAGKGSYKDIKSALESEMKPLLQDAIQEYRGGGFSPYKESRALDMVTGYETQNIERVLNEYFTGIANANSKLEVSRDFAEIVSDMPMGKDKDAVQRYIKEQVRAATTADRVSAAMTGTAYHLSFGLNLKSGLLNYLGVYATRMGALTRFTGSIKEAVSTQATASKQTIELLRNWAKTRNLEQAVKEMYLPKEDNDIIIDAIRSGDLSAKMMREFSSHTQDLAGGKLKARMEQTSSFFFEKAEVASRLETIFAGIDVAKKKGIPSNFTDKQDFLMELLNQSNFDFGKTSRVGFMQGGEILPSVLRGIAPFQSYAFNHMAFAYNLLADKQYKALAAYATTAIGLTGGTGVLFVASINEVGKTIFGHDYMGELMLSDNPVAKIIAGGIPATLNLDVTGSLSASLPFQDSPMAISKWTQSESLKRIGTGEYSKAIEANALTPSSLSNVLSAIRLYTEGKTTKDGKVVLVDGKPVKFDAMDAFLKASGFQPYDYAQEGKAEFIAKTLERKINEMKGDLANKIIVARRNGDKVDVQEIKDMQQDINEANSLYGLKIAPFNIENYSTTYEAKQAKPYYLQ